MKKRNYVQVGILSADQISVNFGHGYFEAEGEQIFSASADGRALLWNGREYGSTEFKARNSQSRFTVKDVTIGVNFHWQRREDQIFAGDCKIILDEQGQPTLVNIIDIEDYLLSVISSEMSANASLNLLKAHAVISRSWLLAQIESKNGPTAETISCDSPERLIRWYDHSSHTLFDVCADDHCQRYQGVARQTTPTIRQAIDETSGEVLRYNGALCDARFSKCCGGVFEEFENCWQPVHYPYLIARRDSARPLDFTDLRIEANASRWINSQPDAFCNTDDPAILSQVLNGYDQETADFYRWTVEYSQEELSDLIRRRSGVDFGIILDLQAVSRGTSGRLTEMRIVGSKCSRSIGKELEIRRTLSETHLYSSAFTIEKIYAPGNDERPVGFRLHGAGWGHGVGLCQIGAAVMGARGYDYRQILSHYFPGATIEKY